MRSPLTPTIKRVEEMIEYVRENLNEVEYDLFLDLLVPEPEVVKPVKKARVKKTRKIEHCVACDYTKRHFIHKDSSRVGYHEFDPATPKEKSAHAQSPSSAIQRVPKGKVDADDDDEDEPRCTYIMGDDEACNATEHSPVHKQDGGYLKWHEFQPGKSVARTTRGRSSANGAAASSAANTEIKQDVVSTAGTTGS